MTQAWSQPCNVLQAEVQVWWHGGFRGRQVEGAGRRERQTQAPAGRHHARQCRPEGPAGKELTTLTKRREAALRAMRDHDISQRRVCQLVGVDPKTVRRTRPPDCLDIREEMKEIAGKRRRFGYRRIGILLERKGMLINHKKLYRLYREDGLSVSDGAGASGPVGHARRWRGRRIPMPAGRSTAWRTASVPRASSAGSGPDIGVHWNSGAVPSPLEKPPLVALAWQSTGPGNIFEGAHARLQTPCGRTSGCRNRCARVQVRSRHEGHSYRWSADRPKQKTRGMTLMFCPLPLSLGRRCASCQ